MSDELKAWPSNWPIRSQRLCSCPECRCDMLVGPCQCGAWHHDGDFELRGGVLYSDNKPDPCARYQRPAT